MYSFRLLLLISLIFVGGNLFAQQDQSPAYVEGQLIVRLMDGKAINPVINDLRKVGNQSTELRVVKRISRYLNIWLVQFDHQNLSHKTMTNAVWQHNDVMMCQLNHVIENRAVPNDPQYNQQWQYDNNGSGGGTVDADLDAPEAWDITTGGLTATGDTIVVCVIDDGIDVNHDDFGDNMWVNYAEIPNNGIDDDNNGFVDDYLGWNADDNNDDIANSNGSHGTPVAGIVGAKGDNGIGVAGVNWDVKLMIVPGGGNEAQALAAYDYPYTMRKIYNQTNGAQGAFVVSTNASWGVNFLDWQDAPIWCAFYDSLGVEGVLNAGATMNINANVDTDGDMPTSCPSDYLMSITNLNNTGNKVTGAAYGAVSVDLGAFGQGTHTTDLGNTYGGFGGTSGATPHVAGAVALLYSAPCQRLAQLAQSDPEAAALLVRDFIYNSVVPNTSLQGITTMEGTLNLKNALDSVLAWGCATSGCYEPFGVSTSALNETDATIYWPGVSDATSYDIRYREVGSSTWNSSTIVDTFVAITGLTACTNYEFQIASDCDTTVTNYTSSFNFKTTNCCDAPGTVTEDQVGETDASFSWASVSNANTYTVEYREVGAATWTAAPATANTDINLTGLIACTEYELRIISTCTVNVNNDYTSVSTFKTKGCGACLDYTYCDAEGNNSSYEWIANVTIGSMSNTTGDDDGYGDYTGTNIPQLAINGTHDLSLTVERNGGSTNVYFKVWIDYDQNGTFDANEEIFVENSFAGNTIDTVHTIPSTAIVGINRMRVAMRWNNEPDECGSFNYGEVEDYCIEIIDTSSGNPTSINENINIGTEVNVFPNPFKNLIFVQVNQAKAQDATIRLMTVTGQQILTQGISIQSSNTHTYTIRPQDLPAGVYILELQMQDGERFTYKVIK